MGRAAALTDLDAAREGAEVLPHAPVPDGWESSGIDQAIALLASLGEPFSADDLRDDRFGLAVKPNEVGPAFSRARRAGVIRLVGYRPSRCPSRHGGIQRVWVGGAA